MAERRDDLLVVALWAAAAAALLQFDSLPEGLRLLAGLPLVLALPGYALSYVVLGTRVVSAVERTVVTVALALTVSILGTLLLDLLSLNLSSRSWSLFLAATTVVACAVAGRARTGVRPERSSWRAPRLRDGAAVGVAVAITCAAVVLARTPLRPRSGVTGYTQLWALPAAGGVKFGVANHELGPVRYRLEVSADGRPKGRSVQLRLSPREQWTWVVPSLFFNSSDVVTARLYRADEPRSPYRYVRLRLSARDSASAPSRSQRTP
jgi:uncharacterized membrane protein